MAKRHFLFPPPPFSEMLSALARPSAFPSSAEVGRMIEVRETHASAVLLAGRWAYKLKKPLDLGFLDYSSPVRRRACCIEECTINQQLAPGVYRGVAPVLRDLQSALSFGAPGPAAQSPVPGERIQGRTVVDYAVVMRRLPDSASLAARLAAGELDRDLLTQVAAHIAAFHHTTGVARARKPYQPVADVLANITQALDQARADIGGPLSAAAHEAVARYIEDFTARARPLLESRLRAGRMRDCHGDLRLEHIYLNPWPDHGAETTAKSPSRHDILVVDRIEFDKRFRVGDVAGEVAFLAVELEAAGRQDLAFHFVRAYVDATGDKGLLEVAPFYMVYRSLVRGVVRGLFAAQQRGAAGTNLALSESRTFYALAARYASTPTAPIALLIGGLMGSGKSTLARALSTQLGWTALASDVTRKRLAGMSPSARVADAQLRELYTAAKDTQVYHQLAQDLSSRIAEGHSVIIDASFAQRRWRRAIAAAALAAGASVIFLDCRCPRELALARLAIRWETKARSLHSPDDTIYASDGRPTLYDRQAARWEPVDSVRERAFTHTIIDTSQTTQRQVEQALQALNIPFAWPPASS